MLILFWTVAKLGGGGEGAKPPIGLKSMQISKFFALFMPIFAPKMKTAPPKGFGSQSCEGLAVVWTRIVEIFVSGAHAQSGRPFFFLFFRRSPVFGQNNPLNFWFRPKKTFEFRRRLFFWRTQNLTVKPTQSCLKLMKIWVKFVCGCTKLPKKPPLSCKILATRLILKLHC